MNMLRKAAIAEDKSNRHTREARALAGQLAKLPRWEFVGGFAR